MDNNITLLIGKNEQGKTNILKALESVNKEYIYESDDLSYNHEIMKINSKIPIITIWLKLNENERDQLSKQDPKLSDINLLKIIKYYDNSYEIFNGEQLLSLDEIDENIKIKSLKQRAKVEIIKVIKSIEFKLEDRSIEQKNINYILSLRKKDGGFGKSNENHSCIDITYFAIGALIEYNSIDLVEKNKLVNFLLSTFHPSGGFRNDINGSPLVKFTYYAISILKKIGSLDKLEIDKCLNYIKSFQNKEGGFRKGAGQPSRIDETYFATKAMSCLGNLDIIDKECIIKFVLAHEITSGGFSSQLNDITLAQSTYYSMQILKDLDALELGKGNMKKHVEYIVSILTDRQEPNLSCEDIYYAVKILASINALEKINKANIAQYLLTGQTNKGGFGFPETNLSISSTYYAIYVIKTLERLAKSELELNAKKLISKNLNNLTDMQLILDDIKDDLDQYATIYIQKDQANLFSDKFEKIIKAFSEIQTNSGRDILNIIPKMIYFDSIDLLRDNINYYEYINNKDKYVTFTNLFKICNMNIEGIMEKGAFQRSRDAARASNVITGLVNESWTQDDITVNVGIDGTEIFVYIEDKMDAHDPPSKRSDGFQWYLSFYINFIAGTNSKYRNAVLLIDNPGLLLHPSAQKDLLRTLQKLSENNQIIFTTHSPYLINKEKLDSIRIIRKDTKKGTKIIEKFYGQDFDALEPIRAALGATIGDSLFGSRENILVEGLSDSYILDGMSYYLKKIGKASIDSSNVSIIPVGGADKILYFALFVWKEGYKLAIVLDNDNEGRKVYNELEKKSPIDINNIIKLDSIGASGNDITIEDLIDPSFYNLSVNNVYSDLLKEKTGKERIEISDLDQSERMQVNRYNKFFAKNKLGSFNKILVAKEIRNQAISNASDDLSKSKHLIEESTITNFNNLFLKIAEAKGHRE